MRKLDLTGKRFGRLLVLRQGGRTNQGAIKWVCQCDCGNITEVSIGHLTHGDTKSCGCLGIENCSKMSLKHGHTKGNKHTPEYDAWQSMKDRCTNPKYEGYHNYGGRGIVVCERWASSFTNFLEDMGSRPSSIHSLDRFPNTNGNYDPSNCRWATPREQAGNKTNNKWIEYNGKKMIQADWARELNIDVRKLHHCLKTWSLEEIDDMMKSGGIINKREKPYNKIYYKTPARAMLGRTGANNPKSKTIYQLDKVTGRIIKEFIGISEAGRQLKIAPANIGKALFDSTKSAGGFKWKFKPTK